jgi:hypothetical protein
MMFMSERLEYKKRIMDSGRNKKGVMSIIIDGMDQNKTNVPSLGGQSAFPKPLEQHVTAVRRHHHGIRFYCTHNTVHKGASLTIYCLSSELEAYANENNGCYPEKLYIQLDGGSENANQWVFAFLELLVIKRVVRVVLYTRLPTGHAHEDIDAIFGTLSTAIYSIPMPTLDDFYAAIHNAFKDPDTKIEVIPVDVIPDYTFLEKHIDNSLSRLHKGIQTQHQWRFEACEVNSLFPRGAKVTYRAYSSNKIVEFENKPRLSCLSTIGRLTGLEPTEAYMRDYPAKDTYTEDICPERMGVEGFYLIRDDLELPNFDDDYLPPPLPFPTAKGSPVEAIADTIAAVKVLFQ